MNKDIFNKKKLLPLILLFLVILLDQISKILIVKYVPLHTIAASFFDEFLRIIYVANTGVAFSLGAGWGDAVRIVLFKIVPIVVLAIVMIFYFKSKDLTSVQCWGICGIVGGGFGNIIDRIFRPDGVVDFIDVKWFNWKECPIPLFRYERWPTFNIADAAVVVCGIILVISFLCASKKSKNSEEK